MFKLAVKKIFTILCSIFFSNPVLLSINSEPTFENGRTMKPAAQDPHYFFYENHKFSKVKTFPKELSVLQE